MYAIANLGSPGQWMILVIICLVIFGAKHLPNIARNLGKGLGEFKRARKKFEEELMKEEEEIKGTKTISAEPSKSEATVVEAKAEEKTEEKKEEKADA